MKNPLENDRKHQNDMQAESDKMLFLKVAIVIAFFLCCFGAVINAVSK